MACDKQIQNIISLNFSNLNDSFNWQTNSTEQPQTLGGKLRLKAQDSTTFFRRAIGVLSGDKNRIRVKMNFEVFRPQTSSDGEICVAVHVRQGTETIGTFRVFENGLTNGERVTFDFDRMYKYENLSGNINLIINIEKGFGNEIQLIDLNVFNEVFCPDSIRSYFALRDCFIQGLNARSVGVKLKEYKVNGVETLTTAYFNEILNVGGSPNLWHFAKADLDGSNAVQNQISPNTWNIFQRDLGLTYETTTSFFRGKPTGTVSGSDYGPGILNLGFGKPEVLNFDLVSQKGVFFIDIDFTQNLKVVFDVIINLYKTNLYDSPSIFRTYTIENNVDNCTRSFTYYDRLQKKTFDEEINGFLSGVTGGLSSQESIDCGQTIDYNGNGGESEFLINLGTETGVAGISYDSKNMPDNYVIEWNGQIFTTGFVGPNSFDQELINSGVEPSKIKTSNPTNGTGSLTFNKNTQMPNTAILRVISPLESADWRFTTICPKATKGSLAYISEGSCNQDPQDLIQVYFDTLNINDFTPSNGDVIYVDSDLTVPYNGNNKTYRYKINPLGSWQSFSFNVSNTGVISDYTNCILNGGGNIIIEQTTLTDCKTCWIVKILVPQGQTMQLSITSDLKSVATYLRFPCTFNAVSIDEDRVLLLTEDTKITFGIEADNSTNTGVNFRSNIYLTLRDQSGVNIIDSEIFGRFHADLKCVNLGPIF